MKKRKGSYSISVVAKMFGVHQQTIRLYEKQGLINPKRSEGNTRQFSEEDVDKLEKIIHMTHKLGINLAGVEMALKLQKKIKTLQGEVNKLFEQTHGQLQIEAEKHKEAASEQARKLVEMKKNKPVDISDDPQEYRDDVVAKSGEQPETEDGLAGSSVAIDADWKIEYDD